MTSESEETNSATSEQPEGGQGEQAAHGEGSAGEASQETTSTESGSEPVDRQQRRDDRWRERATIAEATVERLVRGEVIRSLAGRVSDPEAALRLGEVNVADLLDESGNVDTAEVEEVVRDLVGRYPSLQVRTHHGDIGAKSVSQQSRAVSWSQVLKPK